MLAMTSFISTVLGVFIFTVVSATQVNECILNNATLPEVDIKDCNSSPCVFYIDSVGVMTMKFRSPRYLEHIAPKAQAIVAGFPITYPLDQHDACDGVTNTPCPLAQGEYIVYTFEMPISSLFPPITITLEFSLVDNNDGKVFECFRTDIEIKKPLR